MDREVGMEIHIEYVNWVFMSKHPHLPALGSREMQLTSGI
jgi:hypothetical protein